MDPHLPVFVCVSFDLLRILHAYTHTTSKIIPLYLICKRFYFCKREREREKFKSDGKSSCAFFILFIYYLQPKLIKLFISI